MKLLCLFMINLSVKKGFHTNINQWLRIRIILCCEQIEICFLRKYKKSNETIMLLLLSEYIRNVFPYINNLSVYT